MQDLELRQGKRAGLYQTREFICVWTESGRGFLRHDPQGVMQLLDLGAADSALGSVILEALAKSRVVTLEESKAFLDSASGADAWDAWGRSLMTRYAYPSTKALFRRMKHCGVRWVGDMVGFSPYRRTGTGKWSGLEPSEAVEIKADATVEEIGAAARVALERCIE